MGFGRPVDELNSYVPVGEPKRASRGLWMLDESRGSVAADRPHGGYGDREVLASDRFAAERETLRGRGGAWMCGGGSVGRSCGEGVDFDESDLVTHWVLLRLF